MTTIETVKGSNRMVGSRLAGNIAIFTFLLLLGLFMALPIYLAVIMAFKPVQELFIFPPKLYVIDPTLDNFRDMFSSLSNLWVPFERYLFNSLLVTFCVTTSQCIFEFPEQANRDLAPLPIERHLHHAVYRHGKAAPD